MGLLRLDDECSVQRLQDVVRTLSFPLGALASRRPFLLRCGRSEPPVQKCTGACLPA